MERYKSKYLSDNNVNHHKWEEMPKLFFVAQVQVIVLVI